MEIKKKIDNHILEYSYNYLHCNIITIYYNYNNNYASLKLMYNFKDNYFFGCDVEFKNIFTNRQKKIFIKQLNNVIKKIKK